MRGKSLISGAVLALLSSCPSAFSQVCDDDSDYLGQLSANPFLTDSTSNKFGPFGSRYASESIENRRMKIPPLKFGLVAEKTETIPALAAAFRPASTLI
jgi:hypothetical protein